MSIPVFRHFLNSKSDNPKKQEDPRAAERSLRKIAKTHNTSESVGGAMLDIVADVGRLVQNTPCG